MNQHEKFISDTLYNVDYLLGKDLNILLKNKYGILNGSERKIVQRAAKDKIIHSTDPVTFGNGQFAYLHPSKALNREMILKITKEHRPSLHRVIKMLDYNKGILSAYELLKIAGAPLDKSKNKSDSIDKLVFELEKLNIAQQIVNLKGTKFIVYPRFVGEKTTSNLTELHENRMALDCMFIPDILRSLQRFNIIDNSNVLYRNKKTSSIGISHNNFVWDAIAYTKTTGINEFRASEANSYEKQTLVALDIVVSRPYKDEDLQGFLSRIRSMTNAVKSGKRKVLPVIIYAEPETKILVNRIRKLGFLSFDIGSIYGAKVYEIIKDLLNLKSNGFYEPEDNEKLIEKTLAVIRNAGQEDNLNSIKGDLFESLMNPVLQFIYPNCNIDPGRKLSTTNGDIEEKYEYDYIINSSRLQEIVVVELKGYSSSNYISIGDSETHNTLRWFFRKTLPFAIKHLQAVNKNYQITGCYIATCQFKEDGIEMLEKINKSKLKPSGMDCWYDGQKLLELLDKYKLKKVKEIVRKYYIKEKNEASEDGEILLE